MKAIKRNLKDEILEPTDQVAYCRVCGQTYSANSGDYFMLEPDEKLTCCGKTMDLGIPYSGVHLV